MRSAVSSTGSARGMFVLNMVDFVRETYGSAHEKIVAALPERHAATFRDEVHESAWSPLEDVVAYMEAAKRLLAPADPDFFRKMGFFGGRHDRARALGILVSDVAMALRTTRILWQAFFDTGELDVAEVGPNWATLRVRNFPARNCLCQSVVGSLEGLLSVAAVPVRVEERACLIEGSPYCEFRLNWERSWRPGPDAGR